MATLKTDVSYERQLLVRYLHRRKGDIVWHGSSNQDKYSARQETRVESELSSNDIGGETPDASTHEETDLGRQGNSRDTWTRQPVLLLNSWVRN